MLRVDVQSEVRRARLRPRGCGACSPGPRARRGRRLARGREPAREVSVLFCADRRMRALNRRYRGQDRPTDVLALPGGRRPERLSRATS